MSNGRIAMREIAEQWLKDPEFRAEYEAFQLYKQQNPDWPKLRETLKK